MHLCVFLHRTWFGGKKTYAGQVEAKEGVLKRMEPGTRDFRDLAQQDLGKQARDLQTVG